MSANSSPRSGTQPSTLRRRFSSLAIAPATSPAAIRRSASASAFAIEFRWPCDLNDESPREAKDQCIFDCRDPNLDGDGVDAAQCGGTDCDDLDPNRYPGNREVCDAANKDEDCNPSTFGTKDDDGDGSVDESCCNVQPGGELSCGTDCDDSIPSVNREAIELCNEQDDDCDHLIDEGAAVLLYPDGDRDQHGDFATEAHLGCPGDGQTATKNNDCDDTNPAIQPGAQLCDSASPSLQICDVLFDQAGNVTSIYRDGGPCPDGTACYPQPNGTGVCATSRVTEPPGGGECLVPCFLTPEGVCQCGGGDPFCPPECITPDGCNCGPE